MSLLRRRRPPAPVAVRPPVVVAGWTIRDPVRDAREADVLVREWIASAVAPLPPLTPAP
jgi:hypothetical protein